MLGFRQMEGWSTARSGRCAVEHSSAERRTPGTYRCAHQEHSRSSCAQSSRAPEEHSSKHTRSISGVQRHVLFPKGIDMVNGHATMSIFFGGVR